MIARDRKTWAAVQVPGSPKARRETRLAVGEEVVAPCLDPLPARTARATLVPWIADGKGDIDQKIIQVAPGLHHLERRWRRTRAGMPS